jgi:hypothetical protein
MGGYGTAAVGAKLPLAANVRSWGQSGKHMLALSFSAYDPTRTLAGPDFLQNSARFDV